MLRLSFCGVSHSHFPHFGKPTQLFTKLRTWYQCAYKLPRLALLDYNIWLHCSTKFFSVLFIVVNHYLENCIPFPVTATLHSNCYISIIKLTHQYVEKSMKTLPFCCYILKDYCQIVRDVSDQSISHLIFFKNSMVSKILYKA